MQKRQRIFSSGLHVMDLDAIISAGLTRNIWTRRALNKKFLLENQQDFPKIMPRGKKYSRWRENQREFLPFQTKSVQALACGRQCGFNALRENTRKRRY
jgi:hypothetical protein